MQELSIHLSQQVRALSMPIDGQQYPVAFFRDVVEANPDNPEDFGPATMAWSRDEGMWTLFDEDTVGRLTDPALDHLWKLCACFRRFAFSARREGTEISPVTYSEGRVLIDEALLIASRFMIVAGSYATDRRGGAASDVYDTDYGDGIDGEAVMLAQDPDLMHVEADTEGDGLVLWLGDIPLLVERNLRTHRRLRLHEGIWRLTDLEDHLESEQPDHPLLPYVLELRETAWREAMRRS